MPAFSRCCREPCFRVRNVIDNQHDQWLRPSGAPTLAEGEIHVWRLRLNDTVWNVEELTGVLSSSEIDRAGKYRFVPDANRFIIRRAKLREILGSYTNLPARDVRFVYNRYGKPILDAQIGGERVHFNLSLSRETAVLAVTLGIRIGIDVEFVDPTFPGFEIAEKYFTATEISALEKLSSSELSAAFFYLWTQKEAYVKAIGEGLGHALPDRTLADEPCAGVFTLNGDWRQSHGWYFGTCTPAKKYIASLAVEGKIRTICHWDL